MNLISSKPQVLCCWLRCSVLKSVSSCFLSCFCFTSFCFCLQTLSPAVPHASAREGVCACVRRSAGSHTEASRICACLRGLTHLRKEIVCGLARLRMRGPKRLSTGSRACARVDQRDCLRARASAQAWTKEIVYGLTHLRKRGPKRLSAGSRVCASVDQRDCLRARTSAQAWTKEIVYGLPHRNLTHLCMWTKECRLCTRALPHVRA